MSVTRRIWALRAFILALLAVIVTAFIIIPRDAGDWFVTAGTALVATIVILTARIVVLYYKARQKIPGKRGLLPQHVWEIGVAFVVMSVGFALAVLDLTDETSVSNDLLTGTLLAGGALGVHALWLILGYENTVIHAPVDDGATAPPPGAPAPKRRATDANEARHLAAYAIVVLALAVALLRVETLFDKTDEQRAQRVKETLATATAICERQEVITSRLIDTKLRLRKTNDILRNLTIAVAPGAGRNVAALARAADLLADESAKLRKGQGILQDELDRVDCMRLPVSKPFEGLGE